MKFGVGASQLKQLTPEDAVSLASKMGFDFFQWMPIVKGEKGWAKPGQYDYDLERITALGREAKRLNVPLLSMHLPYLPSHEVKDGFINDTVAAAKAAGARFIIVHPLAYGNYREFFRKFYEMCRAVNLELLLENPSAREKDIGVKIPTVSSPLQFLGLVKESGAAVCYDCNHAIRTGLDPVDFYAMVAKFTKVLHISDAGGESNARHAPIGDGGIDFTRLFNLIRASKFNGHIVIELENSQYQELQKHLDILKDEFSGKLALQNMMQTN